ncbi:MAG: hypothetical protein AB7V34_02370 [Brachymonas sp.]
MTKKRPEGIPIETLLDDPDDFKRNFEIEMLSSVGDERIKQVLIDLVMENAIRGRKTSKTQSARARAPRKTLATDDGKSTKRSLVLKALNAAGPDAITPEVWPHLLSQLDQMGMHPREDGAKDTRTITAIDSNGRTLQFTNKGVQTMLKTIRGDSTSRRGRPNRKKPD